MPVNIWLSELAEEERRLLIIGEARKLAALPFVRPAGRTIQEVKDLCGPL
jgi:hypothetical protein